MELTARAKLFRHDHYLFMPLSFCNLLVESLIFLQAALLDLRGAVFMPVLLESCPTRSDCIGGPLDVTSAIDFYLCSLTQTCMASGTWTVKSSRLMGRLWWPRRSITSKRIHDAVIQDRGRIPASDRIIILPQHIPVKRCCVYNMFRGFPRI